VLQVFIADIDSMEAVWSGQYHVSGTDPWG
jgi:hypothetical protein